MLINILNDIDHEYDDWYENDCDICLFEYNDEWGIDEWGFVYDKWYIGTLTCESVTWYIWWKMWYYCDYGSDDWYLYDENVQGTI